jgi:hypothetical protein
MTAFTDKRSDKRVACKIPVPVHISFFNAKHSFKGFLVDHCINGMGFRSNDAFLLGTAIVFKIEYCTFNGSGNSDLERLPSIRLGEVKWCNKLPAESAASYGVGVRYYPQTY